MLLNPRGEGTFEKVEDRRTPTRRETGNVNAPDDAKMLERC